MVIQANRCSITSLGLCMGKLNEKSEAFCQHLNMKCEKYKLYDNRDVGIKTFVDMMKNIALIIKVLSDNLPISLV